MFSWKALIMIAFTLAIISQSHSFGAAGRVIGKSAQVMNDSVQLLDITLGVEAGASPFVQGFTLKSGLLLNPVPITIDSSMPGLYLPASGCSALASNLPITLDSSTGYYLWNVDDPAYERLMTSPAYIAFTFPPAAGQSDNVTIKAALRLLCLTLDTPLVESPTLYFPCTSISHSNKAYLGRALLQAASIGKNFQTNVSWLAQAARPRHDRTGLGMMVKELSTSDADLASSEASSDTWKKIWEGHLTPLPEPGATEYPDTSNASPKGETSAENTSTGDMAEKPMSTGEITAVIFTTVLLIVGAIGGFVCLTLKRRLIQHCERGCPDEAHVLACPQFAHPVVEMENLSSRTTLA
ncbi:uncharacterized protein J3D65DRAFT_670 [Phyllosticta citribraziliensis]|uniref:Peptidase A1 domain-containing protein n=1 Tax=Phyllosticta citribraziliensis TaxID=989973 RepID=A0ABR1M7X9_9PEZI